jgi:hypothetical protein
MQRKTIEYFNHFYMVIFDYELPMEKLMKGSICLDPEGWQWQGIWVGVKVIKRQGHADPAYAVAKRR